MTEQDEWEKNQQAMTQFAIGAQDKKKEGDEYDFVTETEIEFVEDLQRKGVNVEDLMKNAKSDFEKIQIQRASLPVTQCKEQILEYIKNNNIIVVEAETGSGKTTQIPQFLYEAGSFHHHPIIRSYCEKGKIGCTQPRRVACMEVSARVAQEMGCKLGFEVGYSVRFENKTNERTKIKYLASYSVMMIDEAHERSLHTDVLLGLIKDVARVRDDLKIIISSATMDSEKFSQYFDNAPVLSVGV